MVEDGGSGWCFGRIISCGCIFVPFPCMDGPYAMGIVAQVVVTQCFVWWRCSLCYGLCCPSIYADGKCDAQPLEGMLVEMREGGEGLVWHRMWDVACIVMTSMGRSSETLAEPFASITENAVLQADGHPIIISLPTEVWETRNR